MMVHTNIFSVRHPFDDIHLITRLTKPVSMIIGDILQLSFSALAK